VGRRSTERAGPLRDPARGGQLTMKRFRYDEMSALLPDLEELRPLRNLALRASKPDPERTWSASGELSTVADRIVDPARISEEASELAEGERRHMDRLFALLSRAMERAAGGDSPGAALQLLEAAALEEGRERHDRALAYASSAARVMEGDRNRGVAALALRRWGRAARGGGALPEALRRYVQSHEIASAIGDLPGAGEAAVGAGNVLEQWGRWEEAERWYLQALESLERLPHPTPGRWHAALNLNVALRRRGDVEESRPWLERAEAVARELGDGSALPFLETARGQLLMALGEHQAGSAHFDTALAAAQGSYPIVVIRLNLAESLLALGRVLDAVEQVRTAEAEAIAGGAEVKLPEVYRMLGRAASAQGHPDAFVLFERSLELAGGGAMASELETAQSYQDYARAEAALGNADQARTFLLRAERGYRALGVRGMRREWVDCFDLPFPGDDSSAGTTSDETRPGGAGGTT